MSSEHLDSILVVEDHNDTHVLLKHMLGKNFNVDIFSDVDDAIAAATKNIYHYFVLDINLGESRTGVELLSLLRQVPGHENTPALALTAYAMPGDREEFIGAGFDAYVSKPFTRSELLAGLSTISG